VADYRRPGVYIEEALRTSPFQSANATAVACFVGIASRGTPQVATRIDSWSDFVQKFGGFDFVPWQDPAVPANTGSVLSYLPYAVYSYYQNGGRAAYIVRAIPSGDTNKGALATVTVTDGQASPAPVIVFNASGTGAWGNNISVSLASQAVAPNAKKIFSLTVSENGQRVETFSNLSMGGVQGTRPVTQAVNDPLAGSRYVTIASAVTTKEPQTSGATAALTGGKDPALPTGAVLSAQEVVDAVKTIEGPLIVSFQPFVGGTGAVVMPTANSTNPFLSTRDDIFIIHDGNPVSAVVSGTYTSDVKARASAVGAADSYSAIYAPWIVTPDPAQAGGTIAIPPSGAVTGIIARIDAQIGPWRAPAGIPASVANGLAAEVKFTDTDQGELNYNNINVIRGVTGQGICVMGARTRKLYGPDQYVSARRALIYIKESLRRSTQFAVFENNDANLWSALRQTANRILQPVWEAGGLKGSSTADAYFIRCDATINSPQVIASGEVRMEIGVALQYPAEFIVIRISQYDSGASFASAQIPST
jgi:hypothetical protein